MRSRVNMAEDAIEHLPSYTVVVQNSESGPCEACKEDGDIFKATFWCRHCWDFLCDSCGYTHLLKHPLHRLTPVCRNYAQLKKLKYENRRRVNLYPSYQPRQEPPPPPRPVFVSRPSAGSSNRCSWNSAISRSISDFRTLFPTGNDYRLRKRWNTPIQTVPSATLNCNLENTGYSGATSACFLPNGDLVVVSHTASNMKTYHCPSYGFATETACKSRPFDVTTTRTGVWADLLLVITAMESQLYVYKVKQGDKTMLIPFHRTDTEKQYVGVAGIRGTELLVVTAPGQYPPCLDIISSRDAAIIHSIDDCTSPFSMMRYVSTHGSYVFLTDTDLDTVVCLNLNKTFSSENMVKDTMQFMLPGTLDDRVHRGLTGICVHKGWVFVASQEENKIHVLTYRGKYVGDLVVVNGGLLAPCKVTIDGSGRMAVTQKDGRVRILWVNLPVTQPGRI